MLNHDQLQAYLAAAKSAKERASIVITGNSHVSHSLRTDIPQLADAVVALAAEVEQARKAERDEIIAKGVAWLADFREQDDDDDIVTYPEGAEMLADFIEALGGHVYG